MLPLDVTQTDNHIQLTAATDFSGEAQVTITSAADRQTVLCLFTHGRGVLPLPAANQRWVYQTTLSGVRYIGAQRRVMINGLFNCRDLGGYTTQEGCLTKWGTIYRSDALDHLEKEDCMYLKQMGIASVIDFRSPAETTKNPDVSIQEPYHLVFNPHAEVARQASETPAAHSAINKDEQKVRQLELQAQTPEGQQELIRMQNLMINQMHDLVVSPEAQAAYRGFLRHLVDTPDATPAIFHCQGGKDRTGWAAALVLGLVGVEKETIYQDYLLTDLYNRPRNDARMAIYRQFTDNSVVLDFLRSLQLTKTAYLDGAFNALETTFGTMYQYAETALHFTAEDCEKLKSIMLYS